MTDDPPAPEPGATLAEDSRGVSTTLGYTLTLSITAVLIAGLLTAGGTLIEDQQRAVVTDELTVTGQQLASGFEDADRLAGTMAAGTVRVRVWLPSDVGGGGSYSLEVVNKPTPPEQPARATIALSAEHVDVSRNISFRTGHPVANRTAPGGTVVISFQDSNGDGDRELVIKEPRDIDGPESHKDVVYVDADTGNLSSVNSEGVTTDYGVEASAIGPKRVDIDDDGLEEVPYVTSSNELKLIDADGETQTLATDAAYEPIANNYGTLLAIGEWDGETSVFYMNRSDTGDNDQATIYRVGLSGDPEKVIVDGTSVEVNAIAGIGDINDDGDKDLVYVGLSQGIGYIDDDTKIDTGQGVGANNGIGIGAPGMFVNGEVDRVPFVGGSNNVKLLRHIDGSSTTTDMTTDEEAAKGLVAGIDWTGNDRKEVVYIDETNGTLRYVSLSGVQKDIVGPDGSPIPANETVGVA